MKKRVLEKGDVQILDSGMKHRFTPLEDSKIIEFSTHHEDSDTYRDDESGAVDVEKITEALENDA